MCDVDHYRRELSRVVAGRPWVVAMDVVVSAARYAEELLGLGAANVMAIGASRGTGALPDSARVPTFELGVTGADMMGGIRAGDAALDAVPPDIQSRIDAFDPDGRARVVRTLFSGGAPVGGRPTFGARPAAWIALEDKTTVDQLWDAAAVPRAPSEVVPVETGVLAAAAARLDRGLGTVWVADNREGWHGGAQFLRWVRTERDASQARELFGACADRVRVMPFLDGIPCSIHGIVFADAVIAFRPCEMIVFRVPGESRLAYGAASTLWLPPEEDRDDIRGIAHRVGAHLRESVGYRGCFTIDGVLTAEGFRPTELNPRFGAALSVLATALSDLPLYLLHLAIVAGEDLDYRPADLERLVLEASLSSPHARTHRMVDVESEPREGRLVRASGGFRWASEGEPADLTVELGPSVSKGGFLRLKAVPDRFPLGPPFGPVAAEAFGFVDREWELGIGPLVAAHDVRRSTSASDA